jgi:hypothetical protein
MAPLRSAPPLSSSPQQMKKTEERQRRYGQDNTNPEIQNSRKKPEKTRANWKNRTKRKPAGLWSKISRFALSPQMNGYRYDLKRILFSASWKLGTVKIILVFSLH